jgi:hypothetical protein
MIGEFTNTFSLRGDFLFDDFRAPNLDFVNMIANAGLEFFT